MPRKPDLSLIGRRYGNLMVNKLTDEYNAHNRRLYKCTCLLCGKERLATKQNLQKGEIKDCGNHHKYNDISGNRYSNLIALNISGRDSHGRIIWHCICDCGKYCNVAYGDLVSGKTKSCGCLLKEKIEEMYVAGTAPCKLIETKPRSTNTSGITGVYFDKSRNKWCAEIMFQKKKYHLGRYKNKEEAIIVRKKAEKEIFGGFLEWYAKEFPDKWKRLNKSKNTKS